MNDVVRPSHECFSAFAPYYDLLYATKDYAAEARQIRDTLNAHCQSPAHGYRVLDLGCGTGGHMLALTQLGYSMTGIDSSAAMVGIACSKGLNARVADVRNAWVGRAGEFDAVIGLFHVASYQLTREDLSALFQTARVHLKKEGLLIFDVWNGCAVQTYPPSVRVKKAHDESVQLTRIARPNLRVDASQVDIDYTLYVKDFGLDHILELTERHTLRYWFPSELEERLEACGFKIVATSAWGHNDSYDLQIVARSL